MTFSIIALHPETGAFGVAVASGADGAGSVPQIKAGIGAIANQGTAEPEIASRAMSLLSEGKSAEGIIRTIFKRSDSPDLRQLHVMTRDGASASYSGAESLDWFGELSRKGLSVAGNRLAGPHVLDEMLRAFEEQIGKGASFEESLLSALEAGETTGGDREPIRSAAINISGSNGPGIMIQSRSEADPIGELRTQLEAQADDPTSIKLPRTFAAFKADLELQELM